MSNIEDFEVTQFYLFVSGFLSEEIIRMKMNMLTFVIQKKVYII